MFFEKVSKIETLPWDSSIGIQTRADFPKKKKKKRTLKKRFFLINTKKFRKNSKLTHWNSGIQIRTDFPTK
jgi:hypothetical protein